MASPIRRRRGARERLAAAGLAAAAWLANGAQVPSPPPAPAASGAAHFNVDRHNLTLAPGGSIKVRVFGTASVTLEASFPGIEAVYDLPTRTITVTGKALGTGTVRVSDATGGIETLAVAVVPPAGIVPADVTLHLAGTPTTGFTAARVRAEIRRLARLCAGCTLELTGSQPDGFLGPPASPAPSPVPAGSAPPAVRATASAPPAAPPGSAAPPVPAGDPIVDVKLSGPNAADVTGRTHVKIVVDRLAMTPDPATLFYSDDPENVGANGVLFRAGQAVDTAHPARIYAYHAAAAAGRNIFLVLATTGKQSAVQLVGTTVGPAGDYNCVGHEASRIFLERRHKGEGVTAVVRPGEPYVVQLNARTMPAKTVVSGMYDLAVTAGDPVRVTVVSADAATNPLDLLDGPELPTDGHFRRGEYDLTKLEPLALEYYVGDTNGDSIPIGSNPTEEAQKRGELRALRAGAPVINGEYGVLRTVNVAVHNETEKPATVYLYMTPAEGADTVTAWFAGDGALTEIARLTDPNAKTLVRTFTVPPATVQRTRFEFVADGASWYPLEVGLTEIPPSPPPAATFAACVRALGDQIARVAYPASPQSEPAKR